VRPESVRQEAARSFEQYRGLLFGIAYRMLGSAADAEDVVQETFVRWLEHSDPDQVEAPRAYLATVATRLCLDQLKSARVQRESYVGPWLPEPIITSESPELIESAILRESLSFAFLVMLQTLPGSERAVFVLREVFDYDYREIAEMLEKSESNCRQLFHRAREALAERRARFEVSREQQQRVTEEFVRAAGSGDTDGLLKLLAEEATLVADGGGKAAAGLRPIRTRERVARGLLGNLRKTPGLQARIDEVNGQPAVIATLNGRPQSVVLLEVKDGRIETLFIVANPDKLSRVSQPA
jgi:RNA polymerase sigma-70 factor (ECF subfamily)